MTDFARLRAEMVERQLRPGGITDERVLDAMGRVPRESFVPEEHRHLAYADGALPIGFDQTISQPLMVAEICQSLMLSGQERLLEIGTGSGYSAAVLARLCKEVISIERIPELTERARATLAGLEIENATCITADGSRGWPESAPYDAIAVHAGAPYAPPGLIDQLAVEGRLVIPISSDGSEILTRITIDSGGVQRAEQLGACRFVPLIGEAAYEE